MARHRDDTIKLVFRLPPVLHRRLTRAAVRNNQSLNSEMIGRLEKTLEWDAVERAGERAAESDMRHGGAVDEKKLNMILAILTGKHGEEQ